MLFAPLVFKRDLKLEEDAKATPNVTRDVSARAINALFFVILIASTFFVNFNLHIPWLRRLANKIGRFFKKVFSPIGRWFKGIFKKFTGLFKKKNKNEENKESTEVKEESK